MLEYNHLHTPIHYAPPPRPPEFEDSVPLDAIVSEVAHTPQEVLLNASDNDRLLRRRQIILEWLESCAEEVRMAMCNLGQNI